MGTTQGILNRGMTGRDWSLIKYTNALQTVVTLKMDKCAQ